ncbi:MAG: hypothetical protein ACRC3B_01585 [Bacteroidia bacterium]
MIRRLVVTTVILSAIVLSSCGPSANDVYGYISATENHYYHTVVITKLQNCNYGILYGNNDGDLQRMDSIINAAIKNINSPESINDESAAYNEKINAFFAKDPYFKNLALQFLKDYRAIVYEDLKVAGELYQKHVDKKASVEDARIYQVKRNSFYQRVIKLDSIYTLKKDSLLLSYGEDQKTLPRFLVSPDNSINDGASYYSQSVTITNPLLNLAMVANSMLSGVKEEQQKAYDNFNAKIDTALINILFLGDRHGVIDFINTYKKEWDTNAKLMIGMNRQDAEEQWEKTRKVFNEALVILEKSDAEFAKYANFKIVDTPQ